MTRRLLAAVGVAAALGGGLLLVASATRPVTAEPVWGASCLSCHPTVLDGAIAVVGEDTVADPDESATGAPDRGPLRTFTVRPGGTADLLAEVSGLAPGDTYAVELRGLRYPGVEAGGQLVHAPDCGWAEWVDPGQHYTDPFLAYAWGTGPTGFAFTIEVAAEADPDFYELVFAVAGKRADAALVYGQERFYLQVLGPDLFADGFESGDTSAWSGGSTTGR